MTRAPPPSTSFDTINRFDDLPPDLQAVVKWLWPTEHSGELWPDREPMETVFNSAAEAEAVRWHLGLDRPGRSLTTIARKLGGSPKRQQHMIDNAWYRLRLDPVFNPIDVHRLDVSALTYGPHSDSVLHVLRRARALRNEEVVLIGGSPPTRQAVWRVTSLAAADQWTFDRLRLAIGSTIAPWAPGQVTATVWIAAVNAMLGNRLSAEMSRLYSGWAVLAMRPGADERWLPPETWSSAHDHPVAIPEPEFDLGPFRMELIDFYMRSRMLTKTEVGVLDAGWSMTVWTDPLPADSPITAWWGSDGAPYGRIADLGPASRKGPYRWTRLLASMEFPHNARLAIKDAASAIAMRDLISEADFNALTAPWRTMLAVAPQLDELRKHDRFHDWKVAPWRW